MDKLLSARFYMAIMISATFCYMSAKGMIEISSVVAVTLMVMKDYFQREDRGGPKG